ncbi:MAG: 3-phosphoshikimate 1-carboxyvinyltransferase [bacterium]|nr:3-phosphoshikimate 1-carboxyvinyltransferase [bacterium]
MRAIIPAQELQLSSHVLDAIPGDKSISHRAAILGSLADNVSRFSHFLRSEDCMNTLRIVACLGAVVTWEPNGELRIEGQGLTGFSKPESWLDVGNSGTGIRLLTGVLAAQPFQTRVAGDESISKRPMRRVVDPLMKMGADISGELRDGEICPPLLVKPVSQLTGIEWNMPVASAQVKSALLLAGLWATGEVSILSPGVSRDHTERMLKYYGVDVITSGFDVYMQGGQRPHNPNPDAVLRIPADVSSAMFFIVLGAILGPDRLKDGMRLNGIGVNPTRVAGLAILDAMNADITRVYDDAPALEPISDLEINASDLENVTVSLEQVPNAIDEFPILAVAALFADGDFIVRGAAELRVKESDRIDGIVRMVRAVGGEIEEYDDGFKISGPLENPRDFAFDAHHDHRLAMSAIVLALGAGVKADVDGCESIATSFPNFFDILTDIGVSL